jgi:predicted component of type VI protein secretion system
VSRPDASGWDQQAKQALDDAASNVGTARLALRTAARDRAWSSYTIVLVAKAEETTGKTEQDLSSVQVPSTRKVAARTVLDLLGQAVASVQEARALAADGRYDDRALTDELTRLSTALQAEAKKREAAAR